MARISGKARPRHSFLRCLVPAATALAATFLFTTPGVADRLKQPLPFPVGYEFPLPKLVIATWISKGEDAALRRHGWYLWAGINQPGRDGWPIWASWNTATQVFAPSPKTLAESPSTAAPVINLATINKKNKPSAPINLSAPYYIGSSLVADGDLFQSNGDILIATEAYSQDGYDWIRGQNLFERDTLKTLLADKKTDIPVMPRTSIVLKHMYWPVKHDGLTALPVVDMSLYDRSAVPDTTYVGYENQQRWARAVAIDPSRTSIPPGETASVTYLYDVLKATPSTDNPTPPPLGPLTYPKAKVVPINAFYFKKLSMAEFRAMSVKDQRLINASFYWAHGRTFQDGDYLVAVASHIITKEAPGWTLQTVWWTDEPDATKYAKDRPSIPTAKGPWTHYLLTVEDGTTKSGTLPIAYNPYIELAAAHPVATNCRNCHIRAAYPTGQYLTNSGIPTALAQIGFDNPIFQNELRVDFLWTIVDRAIPVPPQP